MSPRPLMRIGQVCNLLSSEFPDVSISKLRFLEEQGLVTPERTAGGYRMYSEHHLRQLRHILQMQRDEFLPLKVIRDELQRRLGEGKARAAGNTEGGRISLTAPDQYLTLETICQRAQVTPEFVEECRGSDLVTGARNAAGEQVYCMEEVEIISASAQMTKLGIDVRHLRQVRSAVGRQAALIEQFAAARLRARNTDARFQAIKSVELVTQLMQEFMRSALARDVRTMTTRAAAVGEVSGSGIATLS